MLNKAVLGFEQSRFLEEAASRTLAVEDMASFGEYIYPDWYRAYDMHRYIAYYLEQVLKFLGKNSDGYGGRRLAAKDKRAERHCLISGGNR